MATKATTTYQQTKQALDEGQTNTPSTQVEGTFDAPTTDVSCLSKEEQARLGIKPWEGYGWIRNPAYWRDVEFADRARQCMQQIKGARVVTDEHGNPVTYAGGSDLILVAFPKEREKEVSAYRAQAAREYPRRNYILGQHVEGLSREEIRQNQLKSEYAAIYALQNDLELPHERRAYVNRRYRELEEELAKSPTRGRSYTVALKMMLETLAEERGLPAQSAEAYEALKNHLSELRLDPHRKNRIPTDTRGRWSELMRQARESSANFQFSENPLNSEYGFQRLRRESQQNKPSTTSPMQPKATATKKEKS